MKPLTLTPICVRVHSHPFPLPFSDFSLQPLEFSLGIAPPDTLKSLADAFLTPSKCRIANLCVGPDDLTAVGRDVALRRPLRGNPALRQLLGRDVALRRPAPPRSTVTALLRVQKSLTSNLASFRMFRGLLQIVNALALTPATPPVLTNCHLRTPIVAKCNLSKNPPSASSLSLNTLRPQPSDRRPPRPRLTLTPGRQPKANVANCRRSKIRPNTYTLNLNTPALANPESQILNGLNLNAFALQFRVSSRPSRTPPITSSEVIRGYSRLFGVPRPPGGSPHWPPTHATHNPRTSCNLFNSFNHCSLLNSA